MGDLDSIPGLGRSPGEPTPVFWPGESHGLYSPWGRKESDRTERLLLSLSLLPFNVKPSVSHPGKACPQHCSAPLSTPAALQIPFFLPSASPSALGSMCSSVTLSMNQVAQREEGDFLLCYYGADSLPFILIQAPLPRGISQMAPLLSLRSFLFAISKIQCASMATALLSHLASFPVLLLKHWFVPK